MFMEFDLDIRLKNKIDFENDKKRNSILKSIDRQNRIFGLDRLFTVVLA
jgi:hypothetical protein